MTIKFKKKLISKYFSMSGKILMKLTSEQNIVKELIQSNIDTGTYTYESILCPICDDDDFIIIAERDRYNLPTKTSVCRNCGFILSNPRLTQKSLDNFYKKHYRKLYMLHRYATEEMFNISYNKGKKIYNGMLPFIQGNKKTNLSILDIGCGDGGILQYFSDQGHKCIGFDVDSEYSSKTLKLRTYSILTKKFEDQQIPPPNVIICNRTLEHIPNIGEHLKNIRNLMDSNSLLYTSVPSVTLFTETCNRKKLNFLLYIHPAHIYHFSLAHLKNLMSKFGFAYVVGDEDFAIWKKKNEATKMITSTYPKEFYNLLLSQKISTLFWVRNYILLLGQVFKRRLLRLFNRIIRK